MLSSQGSLVLLLLLLGRTDRIKLIFPVARVQALVDLEPVELQLVPELLALLVHDVADALVAVLLLLHVLLLLLLVIVVGLLALPQVVHLLDFSAIGVALTAALRCGSDKVLYLSLQMFLVLLIFLLLRIMGDQ